MPSIKLKGVTAQVESTGFEPYDGPELKRRGMYRARIKWLRWRQFKSGSQGFYFCAELEAIGGDAKAEFNGMPFFSQVVQGEADGSIRSMNNFLAAIGLDGAKEPSIVIEDGGDILKGIPIKTIAGKKVETLLANNAVKLDIIPDTYRGEEGAWTVNNVYKTDDAAAKGAAAKSKATVEADDDEEEDLTEPDESEEITEDDEEYNARSEELTGLSIPKLKAIAKAAGLAVGGTKEALVERILEVEFPEDEESDVEVEVEEDEEEVDGDDVEVEEDEEEADDEEEDDEEGEDDGSAERVAEIAPWNRTQLKAAIKEHQPEYRFLKSQSDDDLRNALIAIEFDDDETPF